MALDPIDFGVIRDLAYARAGIVLTLANEYLVETRLLPIARELGANGVAGLIQRLRERDWSPLHARVVEAMTTNETSFFRDHHPFETLRKQVVPDLIRRNATEKRIHFWCAACSSGQEPYSVLILLREHFPELTSWDLVFWATDYSSQMVERTRSGVFNGYEINRGLGSTLRDRYFRQVGADWQANETLRAVLKLRTLNLTEVFPPMPKFDVIFMRNVLIYFDTETKKRILARTRAQLRPEGLLMLGSTETTLNIDDHFESVKIGMTSCFRVRSEGSTSEEKPPAPIPPKYTRRRPRYVLPTVVVGVAFRSLLAENGPLTPARNAARLIRSASVSKRTGQSKR